MFSSTYETFAEMMKDIRKEKAKQASYCETIDDAGSVVWLYSRPIAFAKI